MINTMMVGVCNDFILYIFVVFILINNTFITSDIIMNIINDMLIYLNIELINDKPSPARIKSLKEKRVLKYAFII